MKNWNYKVVFGIFKLQYLHRVFFWRKIYGQKIMSYERLNLLPVLRLKCRHPPTVWKKLRLKSVCLPIFNRITEIMKRKLEELRRG